MKKFLAILLCLAMAVSSVVVMTSCSEAYDVSVDNRDKDKSKSKSKGKPADERSAIVGTWEYEIEAGVDFSGVVDNSEKLDKLTVKVEMVFNKDGSGETKLSQQAINAYFDEAIKIIIEEKYPNDTAGYDVLKERVTQELAEKGIFDHIKSVTEKGYYFLKDGVFYSAANQAITEDNYSNNEFSRGSYEFIDNDTFVVAEEDQLITFKRKK